MSEVHYILTGSNLHIHLTYKMIIRYAALGISCGDEMFPDQAFMGMSEKEKEFMTGKK